MKWRNQLLALVCLLIFAGLGILYFQHWVVQKPFALILFIGEGLSPHQLAATRFFVGGADARLSLDSMPHSALLMNASKDFAVPDSPAAATAIATGVKVNNRAIAIDSEGKPVRTLVDLARDSGHAVGLVTDSKITNPACAAFYAHTNDPTDADGIARQFVDGKKIDIAMGGGLENFLPQLKGGQRRDNVDLVLELSGKGFDITRTRPELEAIPAWKLSKLFGLFADGDLAFENRIEERKNQPRLSDMVRRAIELLQYNPGGYLLVVDAGLMRKAAQENNGERTLREAVELDRAIATARHYAGRRSTIIVCGDVAVGGMTINGFPFRRDSGIALLGLNSGGQPWITWASGPKGLRAFGAPRNPAEGDQTNEATTRPDESEPGALYSKSALNTADDTIAFGSGPGSEALQGVLENTSIFKIIRDQF